MNCNFEIKLFSPRWGHDDTYEVRLTENSLEIQLNSTSIIATWKTDQDPDWSGSIIDVMRNDNIYPPFIIHEMFEHVWIEWRAARLSDEDTGRELAALAAWINACTHAKPDTEFWSQYF